MTLGAWSSAVGSFVFPGVAQAYFHRRRRAVVLWVADSVLGALVLLRYTRLPVYANPIFFLGWLALRIWIAMDAARTSRVVGRDGSRRAVYGWAAAGGFLVVTAIASGSITPPVRRVAGSASRIPTGTMEPTIRVGNYIVVVSAESTRLFRGAPVVHPLAQDHTEWVVKGVVGLAGDTVSMRQGHLRGPVVVYAEAANDWAISAPLKLVRDLHPHAC